MIHADEKTIWLFDYDLTLYTYREREVLDSLDKQITLFVKNLLKCDEKKASEIRKSYWKKYGTTLSGLNALYGIEPDEYFDFIHSGALIYPKFSPEKRELLRALPGKKVIFTNGRADWSYAGLSSMGILDCFEEIIDLKKLGWKGKPNESAYAFVEKNLEEKYGENSSCVLLDDNAENLLPGRARHWITVLVSPSSSGIFDYCVPTIFSLPEIVSGFSLRGFQNLEELQNLQSPRSSFGYQDFQNQKTSSRAN